MIKITKRSIRRYKNKTIIKNIKRNFYWLTQDDWFLNQSLKKRNRIIGKLLNTRKQCSCNMCRNPRKSKIIKGKSKYTVQELKFIEGFNKYAKYYR